MNTQYCLRVYFVLAVMMCFSSFVQTAQADITTPLYTVEYKPQVIFGDSVPVGTYYGLENYTANYVGGYLHMTYTLTHGFGYLAGYPALLYIRSDNPSVVANTTYVYQGLLQKINDNPSNPTDVYFIDIQFSGTGYREVVTHGDTHSAVSDDTVSIDGMDGNTFIALANQYQIYNPPQPYSMSFQPMRLVQNAPTKIVSLDISTSTQTQNVSVHDFIGVDDFASTTPVSMHLTVGTSTNPMWFSSSALIATTTGDVYSTWQLPALEATLTGFADYTFTTDITQATATSTRVLQSKSVTIRMPTPIIGSPGYSSQFADVSDRINSSYNFFVQTLGTHLTGTLTRMDVQTSNLAVAYYGSQPHVNIFECDDATYGGLPFGAQGCQSIYNADSDERSAMSTSTQSFYPSIISGTGSVVFNPSKYYFFQATGNNMFNTLPYYYGSSVDTVPGQCFQYKGTPNTVVPCDMMSDLYFRMYGIATATVVTPPPPPVGDSNVLFLPGLEASRLYVQTPSKCPLNCEDQLWEPNINSDGVDLYLNANGSSTNPNIYTRDIIKTSNIPLSLGFVGQNIYKSFSDMMDGLVTSGKITEWTPYAYDWRQSVQDVVDNGTQYRIGGTLQNVSLVGTLQALAKSSKSGKVTIIAHSNGGLLAKALLKKLEDDKAAGRNNVIDKIDTVILVASPQLGTPSAVPAILHGYDQDINLLAYSPLDVSTARALGQNMPAAYGLVPSAEYFNHVSTPVVTFVPDILDPWMSKEIKNYGQTIGNYIKEQGFVTGFEGRNNPTRATDTLQPIKGNSVLLYQAETLHNAIDALTVPSTIRLIQIAGWGIDTLSGFQYSSNIACPSVTDSGCTGNYILDEKPIFTSDGDKTVVTPSALAMGGEKWWVNINQYNKGPIFGFDHKDIMEISPLLDFISNTIKNASTTSSVYLSTTTPTDTSNRLRLSVHSPVSIGAYDAQGDFTGKTCDVSGICVVQENIPNSSYYEFGEGKYVNLPQDQLQKVTLQGTDTGTFTFEYQKVAPSGQATTVSFTDIPVTTQTQAVIDVNTTTGNPQLKLDVTGNGTTDFILAPNTTFDPISYLQIMKATVDSLDIVQAKKDAFDKRIASIITSIQKGKIDKAKLKVDKFKSVLENKLSKPDPKKPRPKKLSKTDAQLLLDLLNGLLDNLG